MNVLVYISREIAADERQCLQNIFEQFAGGIDFTLATTVKTKNSNAETSKYALLHIVGCWDATAVRLHRHAAEQHIPVLVSLWGTLTPWHVRRKNIFTKMLLKAGVWRMLRNADAVHACGELESRLFAEKKLNENCERIDNPMLTTTVNSREAAQRIEKLYAKMLDAKPASMLTAEDETLLATLLLAATDPEWLLYIGGGKMPAVVLPQEYWKYVVAYARQEGIEKLINRGIEQLNLSAPEIKYAAEATDANPNDISATEKPLKTNAATKKIMAKINECHDETIKQIGEAVLNMQNATHAGSVRLCQLVNIYTLLRKTSFDEDELVSMLNKTHMIKFFRRIEFVLQQFLKLGDGFMPVAPLSDNEAELLKKKIIKI